jgi:hypothetical protein
MVHSVFSDDFDDDPDSTQSLLLVDKIYINFGKDIDAHQNHAECKEIHFSPVKPAAYLITRTLTTCLTRGIVPE